MSEWLSIISLLISITGMVYIGGWRLGRLELKVDTMWEFLMRRATVEGQVRGFFHAKSPLVVSQEMKTYMKSILEDMQGFYRERGYRLTDLELMMELEHLIGERLVKEVCFPNHMTNGSCLVALCALLREESVPTEQAT